MQFDQDKMACASAKLYSSGGSRTPEHRLYFAHGLQGAHINLRRKERLLSRVKDNVA